MNSTGEPKRLLIISHTPHYRRNGEIVGWGATLREIDELATIFESIVHIAPLHSEPAPGSAIPYQSSRIRLRPVPTVGGESLVEKLSIPLRYPGYARVILQERRLADVIHVRAPANISMLALVLLGTFKHPTARWAKYAGDWSGGKGEPLSYRFQRWWVRHGFHRGVTTVNGSWPNQARHIHSFLNPCLTEDEVIAGAQASRAKKLSEPLRLLFVGRLESAKGVGVCLEIVAELQKAGITSELDLIGDSSERQEFEARARKLGVEAHVHFHGGLPRATLESFYSRTHFILLPSQCSEGWPKVLSEGMAYGAVPVTTAISSIPEFLKKFGTGEALEAADARLFAKAIESYLRTPSRWEEHSMNAVKAAQQFSYGNYLRKVRALLSLPERNGTPNLNPSKKLA